MEKATEEVPSIMKNGELKTLITASIKTLKTSKFIYSYMEKAIEEVPSIMADEELKTIISASVKTLKRKWNIVKIKS